MGVFCRLPRPDDRVCPAIRAMAVEAGECGTSVCIYYMSLRDVKFRGVGEGGGDAVSGYH